MKPYLAYFLVFFSIVFAGAFVEARGADSYEPDDTSGQAKYIANNATQTRSIDPIGDIDWATFSIGQESAVTIETSGSSGDTEMWLYDSSLVELEYNDDIDAIGGNYFSRIDRVCGADGLPAGTYYVRIEEYGDNDIIDPYYLTLTVTPCMGDWMIYVDDDAPNDPGPGDPTSSDPLEDGTPDHPFDAIQEGIDAAVGGDIVMVRDGTYTGVGNRAISFHGKAITVQSQNGPEVTIVDCEGVTYGFVFNAGETPASILQGLTITRGDQVGGGYGGGICCDTSSPTIIGCVITDCAADSGGGICLWYSNAQVLECRITGNASMAVGGGIYCFQSSPTITGCIIQGNQAGQGGGIDCEENGPSISSCEITGNHADDFGGGVRFFACTNATLNNCTLAGNTAGLDGGGVEWLNSWVDISGCTFVENSAGRYGGGIDCWDNTAGSISACTFTRNTAAVYGGGIYYHGSDIPTENCVFDGNTASLGGAVYCEGSSPEIVNCTAYRNTGGGIYCYSSSPTLTNCILWGDVPQEIHVESGGNPTVNYCDVQGGTGQPWFGLGCIDQDPLLLPLAGGTLRLGHGSPCIDAGWGDPPAPATDMEGRPRWDDPNTPNTGNDIDPPYCDYRDIGAHEFKGWYADGDPGMGSDSYNGLYPSWQGGFDGPKLTIQAAIDASSTGDVVTVASWTYTGTGNKDLDFANGLPAGQTRNITLGTSGPGVTIIDCEGSGRGFNFDTGEGPRAVVHGFTITGADSSGIACSQSSPTLINCAISDNTSVYGGGILCIRSSSTITGCTINGNSSIDGAGMDCYESNLTITECVFSGNTADSWGGGIAFEYYTSATISGCTIIGNSAGIFGGGIYCGYGGSSPTITNCVISGNLCAGTSSVGGGAIGCDYYSYPTISNCTIAGNETDSSGGGIYCGPNAGPTVLNCILWADGPEEIHVETGGTLTATYCDVQGGYTGTGNIDADPVFVYPPNGNLRLMPKSPCVDAGTSESTPETDMLGRPRHDSPITPNTGGGTPDYYDIGAHEFKGYFVNDETGNDEWNGLYAIHPGGENGPKKTIQPAIDATVSGDTVVVAPGTYQGTDNRDLDYTGKDITLMSKDGSDSTIIDCQGSAGDPHRGLHFHSGETPKAVVMGFTITNGYGANMGGGIYCTYTSPTILDCTISGNSAFDHGGGVEFHRGSAPTIADCTISGNWAADDGGGIECTTSGATIRNCLIVGNTADTGVGGGVDCWNTLDGRSQTITNCTISGNSAGAGGGGIYCHYSNPTVTDCILWDDLAAGLPDEISVDTGSPTVTYCDVEGGWPGAGNIGANPWDDPLFITGPFHNYYLSQVAAGQPANSPCMDTGSASAEELGLERRTTRTDGGKDLFTVDMGYHAPFLLRITAIYPVGNDIVIEWNARDMEPYTVQWSTDMVNWNPIYVGPVGTWTDVGGMYNLEIYYRVREE